MEKISYKLPVFEGPLDLLLHLISKNKLNICDICISQLLEQYMAAIEQMKQQDLNIESEFFEMAARLVHIKTVMLLPRPEEAEAVRQELEGQLIQYELCKKIAKKMSTMVCFDEYIREPMKLESDKTYKRTHTPEELFAAYNAAVGRGKKKLPPPQEAFTPLVAKKIVPVNVKMIYVLRKVYSGRSVPFMEFFNSAKSKSELVATFLAMLELVKTKRIDINDADNSVSLSDGVMDRWNLKSLRHQ